jgi:hypothetical protein
MPLGIRIAVACIQCTVIANCVAGIFGPEMKHYDGNTPTSIVGHRKAYAKYYESTTIQRDFWIVELHAFVGARKYLNPEDWFRS